MKNPDNPSGVLCQAIIESVMLLKDGSIVAGCNLLSGTVKEGDKLFCIDGVGRQCVPVTVAGIVIPQKGVAASITAGQEKGNRAAFKMTECKITDLHVGHMLQNEPEEILYTEAPGWDAITALFEKQYPGQKHPAHFGIYACLKAGETGPLDGISVYQAKEYFHFVTYGLSELYEKQNGNPNRSGYGFELTVKLKKEGLENPALEVRHMCSILQMIAGITTNGGHQFLPGQILPLSKQRGLDVNGKSRITGFITRADEIGNLVTPFGNVALIQLAGVTTDEMEQLKNKELTLKQMEERIPAGITDYKR
ncbi:MAG: suppressor of fused domain protein [Eubacteriales bacterium]|nr:suppressor of fused domain protein [Eubacteriales bacterium]